ncbi:hypothetical protein SCWH03_21760 [Streptomyces pacificus]|uniref:Uncharacterized protein n=1 Tax=Streptomyces pacificus TaxID=2705029 RepID=A0A6A0AVI6_9ACTN|nr:hypothetical protein SCWH03_21760 [Streptomyces pacificus]
MAASADCGRGSSPSRRPPAADERVHRGQPASGGVRAGGLPGFRVLAAAVVHFQAYDSLVGVELDQEAVSGGSPVDQGVGGEFGDAEPDVLGAVRQTPVGQGLRG